jgi:hypothetical protein
MRTNNLIIMSLLCDDPAFEPDGGLLEILSGMSPFELVEPIEPAGGYGATLDESCGNPIAYRPAFTHDSGDEFQSVEVDLSAYAGGAIRIGFHVGWEAGA